MQITTQSETDHQPENTAMGTLSHIGRQWSGASPCDLWGNMTVVLFGIAMLVCSAGTIGFVSGTLAAPVVITLNSLGLYLSFTVLHDAVHGVAHRRVWAMRFLGTVTGFLLTFTYPFFRGVHMRHHAHANDRASDPDAILAVLPPWLAPWLGGTLLYFNYQVKFFSDRLWRSHAELIEVVVCDVVYLGVLAGAVIGGWLPSLLVLWILPLILTLHVLAYTFDFLPHFPHDHTERLYNARAYGGRLAAIFHLNQNYHLIHHLWPRIPWFRYRLAYLGSFTVLASLGCRLGWKVRPISPPPDNASASTHESLDGKIGGYLSG